MWGATSCYYRTTTSLTADAFDGHAARPLDGQGGHEARRRDAGTQRVRQQQQQQQQSAVIGLQRRGGGVGMEPAVVMLGSLTEWACMAKHGDAEGASIWIGAMAMHKQSSRVDQRDAKPSGSG